MKTLVLLVSLIFGGSGFAAVNNSYKLTCGNGGNSPQSIVINFRPGFSAPLGSITGPYNGAALACKRLTLISGDILEVVGGELLCVGVWDHTVTGGRPEPVDNVVKVKILQNSKGQYFAKYVENFRAIEAPTQLQPSHSQKNAEFQMNKIPALNSLVPGVHGGNSFVPVNPTIELPCKLGTVIATVPMCLKN